MSTRGPRRRREDDCPPPQADWRGHPGDAARSPLDIAAALGEVPEPSIDSRICGSVLAGLRRDPPPRYADAQAQVADQMARWEAPGDVRRGSKGPQRSRSNSRGPPLPLEAAPSALAGMGPIRPPRPGVRASACAGLEPLAVPAVRSPGSGSSSGTLGALATPQALPQVMPRGTKASSSDDSLISSMAARLAQVENLNKTLSAKVAQQTQEMEAMREELEAYRRSQDAVQGDDGAASFENVIRDERDRLKLQVEEMTKFLEGYGLKWVSSQHENGTASSSRGGSPACASRRRSPAAAEAPPRSAAPEGAAVVDIKVLASRVDGLNALLEEAAPQCVHGRDGGHARLALDSVTLPVTFFCDGIKLGDHAFWQYESACAQGLIKDILNGARPQVLQKDHPDGVALRVVDRTGHGFAAWLRDAARDDPDLADGGERLRPSGGRAIRAPADSRSASERLVAKLPERVVRDGKVCEVRGPVAERLGLAGAAAGVSSSASSAPTPGSAPQSAGPSSEVSLLEPGRDAGAPSARLQVKLETGQRVLLCMEPHATIGALWDALGRWRAKHSMARMGVDGRQWSLRSVFPPCTYSDHEQTLDGAGLTPSATLFVSVEGAQG